MMRWHFLVSKARDKAFLTSRNVSKHVLLALSVDRTAGDAVKVKFIGFLRIVSQATPFAVSCETGVRYRQASSQDVKQMLWSLPLKSPSRSLMAQRY